MKYNTRTEALIRASIDHWMRLADLNPLPDERSGARDCPLCQEDFGDMRGELHCSGCPIVDATNGRGCYGSPYHAADKALYTLDWRDEVTDADREHARIASMEMVEFLMSLLPGGHQ